MRRVSRRLGRVIRRLSNRTVDEADVRRDVVDALVEERVEGIVGLVCGRVVEFCLHVVLGVHGAEVLLQGAHDGDDHFAAWDRVKRGVPGVRGGGVGQQHSVEVSHVRRLQDERQIGAGVEVGAQDFGVALAGGAEQHYGYAARRAGVLVAAGLDADGVDLVSGEQVAGAVVAALRGPVRHAVEYPVLGVAVHGDSFA
ncbi:uncharacterized protein BcabD6B2_07540 [Babesia caballi]|uniref:Uncharacterized protein n=1 Tax=Babesia caballi TaxID=5871 RepID=A0AAV4LRM5_BABCB|nr:hypothetical protein, conserved [Babesia caballi]